MRGGSIMIDLVDCDIACCYLVKEIVSVRTEVELARRERILVRLPIFHVITSNYLRLSARSDSTSGKTVWHSPREKGRLIEPGGLKGKQDAI